MPSTTTLRPLLRATHRANVMGTQVALAAAVAGIGAYAWYWRSSNTNKPDKPIFSSFGFHTLRLDSTELINHNTKKLRFELPDASKPSGLSLTSALLTISFPNGRWLPVLRPYTPVNDLNEPGYIELMVKLYPNGKQSTHLHSLKPGDTLTFAPIKELAWTPNKHEHVALIAGGAGITPMYQLARGILHNPDDRTRVTLVWGVNTDEDIFLKNEFAALEKLHPGRFRAVYVVVTPGAGSPHQKGFVTRQLLEKAGLAASEAQNRDIKVLVCGPPAMEKALKGKKGGGVLAELGYRPDQVYSF
ncbi:ferredoxin reductase-like protein [Parathielavia appendiculata]|uniref:NADH-cytochrome b5 reductase 2 n=1 Tax=Parathielavia appendiculata TaxID=2587402 RepID=A0AAN6TVV0_9PEZI|nr:ferredoxin reductase-like protein [Parathielavia appendiculata]